MSNPTQQSLAKLKRLVRHMKRERQWDRVFSYGRMVERSDGLLRFRLGSLHMNSKIIKRRRGTVRQSHSESIHTQAKDHCKKQRRSRAVCCIIESV